MSQLKVDTITDAAGTGAPNFTYGVSSFQPQQTGADTDVVLDLSSEYVQKVTPTATRSYTLPGTGIGAGATFTFINCAALGSGFDITVKAPDAATLRSVAPQEEVTLRALVADPTVAANWKDTASITKWQKKTLPGNFSTPGTAAAISYTGLEIGRTYRITMQISMDIPASGSRQDVYAHARDGANVVAFLAIEFVTSPPGRVIQTFTASGVYTATATTMNIDYSDLGGGEWRGGETWSQLEELPNHIETTEW